MKEPKAGKCQATPDRVPLSSLPHGVEFGIDGLRFTTGQVDFLGDRRWVHPVSSGDQMVMAMEFMVDYEGDSMEERKFTKWDSHPGTADGVCILNEEGPLSLHTQEGDWDLSLDQVEELHSFLGDYLATVPHKVTLSIQEVSPGESFEWLERSWKREHGGLLEYTWCVGTDGTRLMLQNEAQVVVTRKGTQ